jgi:beta-phosphoglucomutase-like phosphatase (HAD superfamily)
MVQRVVFDIDGTIIDSVDLHIESWKRSYLTRLTTSSTRRPPKRDADDDN